MVTMVISESIVVIIIVVVVTILMMMVLRVSVSVSIIVIIIVVVVTIVMMMVIRVSVSVSIIVIFFLFVTKYGMTESSNSTDCVMSNSSYSSDGVVNKSKDEIFFSFFIAVFHQSICDFHGQVRAVQMTFLLIISIMRGANSNVMDSWDNERTDVSS